MELLGSFLAVNQTKELGLWPQLWIFKVLPHQTSFVNYSSNHKTHLDIKIVWELFEPTQSSRWILDIVTNSSRAGLFFFGKSEIQTNEAYQIRLEFKFRADKHHYSISPKKMERLFTSVNYNFVPNIWVTVTNILLGQIKFQVSPCSFLIICSLLRRHFTASKQNA